MYRTRLVAALSGGVIAALATVAFAAPANATVVDYPNSTAERYPSANGPPVRLYPVVDSSHKASYAYVVAGRGSVQARAQCQRGDGRTSWYESTINAGSGSTSHYDCDNNGTYNRAVVGLGADIH